LSQDERYISSFDRRFHIATKNNPDPYVDSNGDVKVRVGWEPGLSDPGDPWYVYIDQANWKHLN
jgi:hypothetical protein